MKLAGMVHHEDKVYFFGTDGRVFSYDLNNKMSRSETSLMESIETPRSFDLTDPSTGFALGAIAGAIIGKC